MKGVKIKNNGNPAGSRKTPGLPLNKVSKNNELLQSMSQAYQPNSRHGIHGRRFPGHVGGLPYQLQATATRPR